MKRPKKTESLKHYNYLDSIKGRQDNATGFQNPADDFISLPLDLNRKFIKNPPATYILKIGDNIDTNIKETVSTGDFALVDRSLHPTENNLVIVDNYNENDFKIKIFDKSLFIKNGWNIWGIVTYIIKHTSKS